MISVISLLIYLRSFSIEQGERGCKYSFIFILLNWFSYPGFLFLSIFSFCNIGRLDCQPLFGKWAGASPPNREGDRESSGNRAYVIGCVTLIQPPPRFFKLGLKVLILFLDLGFSPLKKGGLPIEIYYAIQVKRPSNPKKRTEKKKEKKKIDIWPTLKTKTKEVLI